MFFRFFKASAARFSYTHIGVLFCEKSIGVPFGYAYLKSVFSCLLPVFMLAAWSYAAFFATTVDQCP